MNQEDLRKKLQVLLQVITIDMLTSTNSSTSLKKKGRVFKVITLITSSILTVVLGINLKVEYEEFISNTALIISALLTGLSGWEAYSKYEQRALQEHNNANGLAMLYKDILIYQGSKELNDNKIDDFVIRYQKLQEQYFEEAKTKSPSPSNPAETPNVPG